MEPIRFIAMASQRGGCVRVGADGLLVDFPIAAALLVAQTLSEGDEESLTLFGGGEVPISTADGKRLARIIMRTAEDVLCLGDPPQEMLGLLAQTKIACLPDCPAGPLQ